MTLTSKKLKYQIVPHCTHERTHTEAPYSPKILMIAKQMPPQQLYPAAEHK